MELAPGPPTRGLGLGLMYFAASRPGPGDRESGVRPNDLMRQYAARSLPQSSQDERQLQRRAARAHPLRGARSRSERFRFAREVFPDVRGVLCDNAALFGEETS